MNAPLFSSRWLNLRRSGAAAGCGLLGLLLTSSLTARAQGAENNPAAKSSGKDYVLAHKSSYTGTPATRSPFWPIGWVPSAPVPVEAAVVVATVKPEDFVVTSISLDYPPLAVINKHTYGVGERIPVGAAAAGSASAKGGEFVTVRQISDGTVVLDHRGTLLRCATNVSLNATRAK